MRRLRGDGGFSAVELLVAITLTSVVSAATVQGIVQIMRVSTQATARVDVLTDIQLAQERMSRNVRAADPISVATATDLEFQIRDSITASRTVAYSVVGDTLEQTITAAAPGVTTPLIDGLDTSTTPVFTYFSDDGAVWDGVSTRDINEVAITLRVVEEDVDVEIVTSVFLRNTAVEER